MTRGERDQKCEQRGYERVGKREEEIGSDGDGDGGKSTPDN